MLGTRLRIASYARQHRHALLDLTATSPWTHTHIDWYELAHWLDMELGLTLLAWHGEELAGYISLSLPNRGRSWIRMLGIRGGRMPGQIVDELWASAEAAGRALGIIEVAILMISNWLPAYLARHRFQFHDDIISMSHIGSRTPAAPATDASLRPAEWEDIPRILEIDHLAFEPIWQLTLPDLQQALRHSTMPMVAALGDHIVAYQLSTQHETVGHLARLAVDPAHQRRRIGSLLLRQLLEALRQKKVDKISLNTQLSNLPSQHLYQRYGFFRNGNDIELWRKRLA